MYVGAAPRAAPALRRRCCDTAEAHARGAGAQRLVLWTDTRFDARARLLREARLCPAGLDPHPGRRLELARVPLRQADRAALVVEALDAAAAATAERRLADLLIACVDGWRGRRLPAPLPTRRRAPSGASAARRSRRPSACCSWPGAMARWRVPSSSTSTCRRTSRTAPRCRSCWSHPEFRRRGVGRALMRADRAGSARAWAAHPRAPHLAWRAGGDDRALPRLGLRRRHPRLCDPPDGRAGGRRLLVEAHRVRDQPKKRVNASSTASGASSAR